MCMWWHNLKQMKSNTISLWHERWTVCIKLSYTETELCKGGNMFLTIQPWRSKESHLETDQRKLSKENRTEILHTENRGNRRKTYVNWAAGLWHSKFSENQPGLFKIRTILSLHPDQHACFHKPKTNKIILLMIQNQGPTLRQSSEAVCGTHLILGYWSVTVFTGKCLINLISSNTQNAM